MKVSRLLLVIALLAVAFSLILPSVSWAIDPSSIYKAKCAVCHGTTGNADTPLARKESIPSFASDHVKKQSSADIADFILNGGKVKKSSHAWSTKGISTEDGFRLAAYVKQLGAPK